MSALRSERREKSPWQDLAIWRQSPPLGLVFYGSPDKSWLARLRQEPEFVLVGASLLVGVFLGLALAALLRAFEAL